MKNSLPYKLWIKFGLILSYINTRIILSLVFFCILTPTALILKLFRYDPLQRKITEKQKSYWKKREEQPESMKYQF